MEMEACAFSCMWLLESNGLLALLQQGWLGNVAFTCSNFTVRQSV